METALDSVAILAVFPLQDVLSLGSEGRMNTPGTSENNWCWRFSWSQLQPELAVRLRQLVERYHRNPRPGSSSQPDDAAGLERMR